MVEASKRGYGGMENELDDSDNDADFVPDAAEDAATDYDTDDRSKEDDTDVEPDLSLHAPTQDNHSAGSSADEVLDSVSSRRSKTSK